MANEILPAGIGDLTTRESMAAEYLMLLADRDGSILTHPALLQATSPSATSAVFQVPHLGLGGYDLLSTTTPGSDIANTALTDGSTAVTLAMRGKAYTRDDFARYEASGKLDPVMFAQDAAISVAQTLISLIAAVVDDFSNVAGASGVDCSWNDIQDAKTLLGIAKAGGPLMAILHPRQWGDLEQDAMSLGYLPAQSMAGVITQGLGDAYKGRWMGIDVFVSSHVGTANAGADRAGGVFARGGVAWADAQMADEMDPNIVNLGRARFERVRKGLQTSTAYVTSYVCGVSKAIDLAGVSVITDA